MNKGNIMATIIIVILAFVVGFSSYLITDKADNPIEQAAEAVIDYELGIPQGTIDLSKEDN